MGLTADTVPAPLVVGKYGYILIQQYRNSVWYIAVYSIFFCFMTLFPVMLTQFFVTANNFHQVIWS